MSFFHDRGLGKQLDLEGSQFEVEGGQWKVEGESGVRQKQQENMFCLLYTSPSPRDLSTSRMPSSA